MVGAFTAFILFGTALLWLPISADGPGHIGLEDALFTSTSAATVTGLGSTDVSRFSLFGELVIMMLIQIGGFGIMTAPAVGRLAAAAVLGEPLDEDMAALGIDPAAYGAARFQVA